MRCRPHHRSGHGLPAFSLTGQKTFAQRQGSSRKRRPAGSSGKQPHARKPPRPPGMLPSITASHRVKIMGGDSFCPVCRTAFQKLVHGVLSQTGHKENSLFAKKPKPQRINKNRRCYNCWRKKKQLSHFHRKQIFFLFFFLGGSFFIQP